MPFTETMTPRERTLAALRREPVDRPPVANPTNVATVDLMDLVDAPFPDACRDPELRRGWRLRVHGTGLRRGGAVLHYHPGVVGAWVRDAVGG